MQDQFPPSLIARCQKLIFERSGKKISKAKAELYLEKFSRLMMLAVKILDQEAEAKKTKNKSNETNNPHR
jgi:hypothetical protein